MIPWRELVYDFPDDGGATLAALFNQLPDRYRNDLVHIKLDGFRLRNIGETTTIFLLMAVSDLEKPADHPFLNPGELYVPDHRRAECDEVLRDQATHGQRWSTLECVSGCDPAMIAFDQLWKHNVLPIL